MIVAYIDGERVVFHNWHDTGDLLEIETDSGDYYIFESKEDAGKAAREYWEDMAENDPEELAAIVGEKNLVQWGLGRPAGPGTSQVCSLEEWLDLWLDVPEEHFASYDSQERVFVCRHPDFSDYTVAYRHN